MSTALSWAEPVPALRARLVDPVVDLRALLRFRSSGLDAQGRRRMRTAGAAVLALTIAVVVVPAYAYGAAGSGEGHWAGTLVAILPSVYLGFLVLAVVTAAAGGGGREVVPRDQAVAWPVSSTTDHLGALLLAPLNIAWLLEAWTLLGVTSYVVGPRLLPLSVLPVLAYLVLATAIGQVVGWLLELCRRGEHGRAIVRTLSVVLVVGLGALAGTHRLTDMLDRSPTVRVLTTAIAGTQPTLTGYAVPLLGLVALAVAAVLVGAVPARWASSRAPRDEHRLESGVYRPRTDPVSDLRAMVRLDRAGVWRSVPLRRGLLVLAVMPGVIAFAGHLPWAKLTIMPGLVASGAALLFGVNGWCLDGRGGLWRESLPFDSSLSFASRVWVLVEVLLGTAALTLLLAGARAGLPSTAELVAVLASTAVVTGQVLSASMRWSVRRPFAVDMRSARATPAPPVVMVGYSARLAMCTTFVGLIFSGLATLPAWYPSLLVALPLVLFSAWRVVRVRGAWAEPDVRARVVVTVAG